MTTESTLRAYEGGCHCGRVRFRVRTSERVAYECNCSVCAKKGLLHLIVTSESFELLSGLDAITTYTFGTHTAKHMFCAHCGVQSFYVPRSHPNGIDVNVRCLDGQPLDAFKIEPFDGRNWEQNVDRIR